MATLAYNGIQAGRPVADVKNDVLIQSAANKDVVIRIMDTSNQYYLKFQDGTSTVRASIRSDGAATFSSLNATLTYNASFAAGSVAAANTNLNSALDAIFSGSFVSFNEEPPQIPDGVTTHFTTTGGKKFQPGKIMVFLGGLKQKPLVDYTENISQQAVDFLIAPPTGLLVEFSYIIG